MTVAITGATGLVGRVAVHRFTQRGDEVVAIGRSLDTLQGLFGDQAVCVESDYSRGSLRNAFKGVDIVIHLAARRIAPLSEGFRPFFEANVQTTESVIFAACDNRVSRLCQASSISVYSLSNKVPFTESEPPVPLNLYGVSKLACEHLATLCARRFPIHITSLRISRILGCGDRTGEGFMLMNFIQRARRKQPLHVWGEGVGARDTIYVKDVVGAIDKAIEPDAPCGVFNIGGGRAFSHREVAEMVNEVFDNSGNIVFDTWREEDMSCFFMDCSRAEFGLNWQRKWSLRKGLQEMKQLYEQGNWRA